MLALTIFLNLAPGVIHKGVDCGHTHTKKEQFSPHKEKAEQKKKPKKHIINSLELTKKKKKKKTF